VKGNKPGKYLKFIDARKIVRSMKHKSRSEFLKWRSDEGIINIVRRII